MLEPLGMHDLTVEARCLFKHVQIRTWLIDTIRLGQADALLTWDQINAVNHCMVVLLEHADVRAWLIDTIRLGQAGALLTWDQVNAVNEHTISLLSSADVRAWLIDTVRLGQADASLLTWDQVNAVSMSAVDLLRHVGVRTWLIDVVRLGRANALLTWDQVNAVDCLTYPLLESVQVRTWLIDIVRLGQADALLTWDQLNTVTFSAYYLLSNAQIRTWLLDVVRLGQADALLTWDQINAVPIDMVALFENADMRSNWHLAMVEDGLIWDEIVAGIVRDVQAEQSPSQSVHTFSVDIDVLKDLELQICTILSLKQRLKAEHNVSLLELKQDGDQWQWGFYYADSSSAVVYVSHQALKDVDAWADHGALRDLSGFEGAIQACARSHICTIRPSFLHTLQAIRTVVLDWTVDVLAPVAKAMDADCDCMVLDAAGGGGAKPVI